MSMNKSKLLNLILSDPKKFNGWVMVTFFLLGLLTYSNTLGSPFQFDDEIAIERNIVIRNLGNPEIIFKAFNTRFIAGLSLALNYWIGGLNVFSYRLLNILIHVTAAYLVYYFVILLFRTPQLIKHPSSRFSVIVAVASGLIFLVHPIQTEAVVFLTQRTALLASVFYLFTLIFYLQARLNSSRFFLAASFFTAILAIFSKEFTATLPFMIVLIEFYSLRPSQINLAKRALMILPFFLSVLLIPLMFLNNSRQTVLTARMVSLKDASQGELPVFEKINKLTKATDKWDRAQYFLMELNVVRTYLRLLFFPVNQNIDYDYPPSKSFFEPKTILSFCLHAALLITAAVLFGKQKLISFCIIWFYLTLSIESSFIPIGHAISEYRLYLPMAGFAIALSMLLWSVLRNEKKTITLVLILVLIFSGATFQRNVVWGSQISLWQDTILKSPNKARPYINLAAALKKSNRFDEAIFYHKKAIELDPKSDVAHMDLGLIYFEQGKMEAAMDAFKKAITLNPYLARAYGGLALVAGQQGDFDTEIVWYQRALSLDPGIEEAYTNLGLAYTDKKDFPSAFVQVQKLKDLHRYDLATQLNNHIRYQMKQQKARQK